MHTIFLSTYLITHSCSTVIKIQFTDGMQITIVACHGCRRTFCTPAYSDSLSVASSDKIQLLRFENIYALTKRYDSLVD